ncbi:MAG: LTA synthase family protein [Faecousia sp.]
MDGSSGKPALKGQRHGHFFCIPLSFFLTEVFAFFFLSLNTEEFALSQLWPLAFGALWAAILGGFVRLFPVKAGRVVYGILYFVTAVYAAVETGYYILFSEMMWLSDFRYASEGSDYLSVLLSYPPAWWLGLAALTAQGVLILRGFPVWKLGWLTGGAAAAVTLAAAVAAACLPRAVFLQDGNVQYAASDYGRAQSAEAAYDNMFNAHRLYQVCGLYQTLEKDIYQNGIYPLTPGYAMARKAAKAEINAYFAAREEGGENRMTGLLEGKNVVLVLMESMDDWMIGAYTPTLERLMNEGIRFTNFYTPGYGGIRTFNTEFCINTGSFLSSQGGYAFDYVTNSYRQSLASLLTKQGYSAKTFHYNDPDFYSRGVFSPAMGYSEYVCYADFIGEEEEDLLYDDQLLFDNPGLNAEFFREGQPTLNFIITRSAHLSYKYNEVLSYWALNQYPEFHGLTGNEETDCAYLKAKLVDDLFARLLLELEDKGQLQNTVIIGVTDHYTYGYKDEESLFALSGVEDALLLEKTPCFIWSADLKPMKVDKILNTSDLLPTVLNLLGVDSPYRYIGRDAFDPTYQGYALFSDGSWIAGDAAYDAGTEAYFSISGAGAEVSEETRAEMAEKTEQFVRINNLILETDYYKRNVTIQSHLNLSPK